MNSLFFLPTLSHFDNRPYFGLKLLLDLAPQIRISLETEGIHEKVSRSDYGERRLTKRDKKSVVLQFTPKTLEDSITQ